MPPYKKVESKLDLFYLFDCSGSMSGSRIAALNAAMNRLLPDLLLKARSPLVEVRLGILCFSSTAHWQVKASTTLAAVKWFPIRDAVGLTALGQALQLLKEHLLVLESRAGQLPPVIVLVSDGLPTDAAEEALAALLATGLGGAAGRYAIALGSEVDVNFLMRFTGHQAHITHTSDSAVHLKEALLGFSLQGMHSAAGISL